MVWVSEDAFGVPTMGATMGAPTTHTMPPSVYSGTKITFPAVHYPPAKPPAAMSVWAALDMNPAPAIMLLLMPDAVTADDEK